MTYPNNSNTFLPGVIQTPSALQITNIFTTNPMIVVTQANPINQVNTYIPGQLVKLTIPFKFGMQQANGLVGKILTVLGNSMTLDINAQYFDPFIIGGDPNQIASLAPSGSRNLQYDNTTRYVPFQSFNNNGN